MMATLVRKTVFSRVLTFAFAAIMAGILLQPQAAAQFGQKQLSVELAWESTPARPGSTARLGVVMQVIPGWHIQAGKGSGKEGGDTIPTTIVPTLPDGWTVSRILWPEAHDFVVGDGPFAQRGKGYFGRTVAIVEIDIPADADGEFPLTVDVGYQSCDDTQCAPPSSVSTQTSLTVSRTAPQTPTLSDTLAALFAATDAANPPAEPKPSPPVAPQEVELVDSGRVRAGVTWYQAPEPGSIAYLGVIMEVEFNWHVQAGKGSPEESTDTIPTSIDLTLPEGWNAQSVLWPHAEEYTIGEGAFALRGHGYLGTALAIVPIEVPASATPGSYPIDLTLTYQACDDTSCEPPVDVALSTTLEVLAAGSERKVTTPDQYKNMFERLFEDAGVDPNAALPADTSIESEDTETAVAENNESGSEASVENANAELASAPPIARPTFFGIEIPRTDGALGLIILALLSAIGGFILNLTPCVLPVIPIKIMTISQHANSPGKSLVLGIWMALGVVAFWLGIGVPVAFVSTITDPSRIFGFWWVTFGIGALIGVMGIGIMGMFTIRLPQSVYAVNPKADTAFGSFMFGVMTAVLGLPCFGFVAGALLAGAATMPAQTVLVIFGSLGVGMAAPYLVLAAKPALVERIPRTGPASELVKQVMGLLLLAASAYFIGSGLIGLTEEKPYLSHQLHWWAIAIFASLAGLWLIMRTFQITKRGGPRLAFSIVGLILALVAVWYANDSTTKARANWELLEAAKAKSNQGAIYYAGVWNDYSEAAFNQARADGKVVVLDFTATWCLNCKALKAAVLNRDPVKSELLKDDVVNFTVDLTSTKAPGWDMLHDLGQVGIPLLVIYTPNEETPWQANAYTSNQVIEALEAARAQELARR